MTADATCHLVSCMSRDTSASSEEHVRAVTNSSSGIVTSNVASSSIRSCSALIEENPGLVKIVAGFDACDLTGRLHEPDYFLQTLAVHDAQYTLTCYAAPAPEALRFVVPGCLPLSSTPARRRPRLHTPTRCCPRRS